MTDEAMRAELARSEVGLALARDRFVVSLRELKQEVARTTNVRSWIHRRPKTFLAAAFAIGFLAGSR